MVKKIIYMVLTFSIMAQADAPECPPSIASDLQEVASHLYASAKNVLHGVKNVAQAIPPLVRAGEKSVTNTANFIDRYPAVSCTAAAMLIAGICYYKYVYKKPCRCARQCRFVCCR